MCGSLYNHKNTNRPHQGDVISDTVMLTVNLPIDCHSTQRRSSLHKGGFSPLPLAKIERGNNGPMAPLPPSTLSGQTLLSFSTTLVYSFLVSYESVVICH